MHEQPPRRWFRFKLSTVLILTAIAAWGMACRPWGQYKHDALSIPALTKTIHFEVRWDIPNVSSERPFPTPSNKHWLRIKRKLRVGSSSPFFFARHWATTSNLARDCPGRLPQLESRVGCGRTATSQHLPRRGDRQ
ncbi:MAG: hypothetical protein AB7U73_17375 [Pirellulales bacterium]